MACYAICVHFFVSVVHGDIQTAALILSTEQAREQKALGRKVRGFSQEIWDLYKEDVARQGNLAKVFTYYYLLSTYF